MKKSFNAIVSSYPLFSEQYKDFVELATLTVACKLINSSERKTTFLNLFPFQSNNNHFQLEIWSPLFVVNSITRVDIAFTSVLQL